MKRFIFIALTVCVILTLTGCSLSFVREKDGAAGYETEYDDDNAVRERRTTEDSDTARERSAAEDSDAGAGADGTGITTSNSRSNPANVNEKTLYDSMGEEYNAFKVEITLEEVLRGGAALKSVIEADIYNDIPPEGKEYLLAKFNITALQSKNDRPIDVGYLFGAFKSNGNKYDDPYAYVENIKTLNTMYQGSEQEGYVCFIVDKEDIDTLISFPLNGQTQVWFSGKQSVDSDYDNYVPIGDPNRLGSKNNPARLNETVNFNGLAYYRSIHEFNVNITITELLRGQRALDIAMLAYEYNSAPPKGKEFLFARVKIEAIESKDNDIINIDNISFKLINHSDVRYFRANVYGFDNEKFSPIYPGESQEGYLFFVVDVNDPDPFIVAFEYSDTPLWFSTAESNSAPLNDTNSIDNEPLTQSSQSSRSTDSVTSSLDEINPYLDEINPYIESWALGCSAILAIYNGFDPYKYGMFEKNNETSTKVKLMLSTSLSCKNREDLIDTILSIADDGYNRSFADAYKTIVSASDSDYKALLEQSADDDQRLMVELTKTIGDKWGDKQIKALDWFRMIHLSGWGYIAGYLDLEESYDYMLPSISNLKSTFSSWDESYENWLDGFAWLSGIDISEQDTDYTLRASIYETFRTTTVLFDPTVWD